MRFKKISYVLLVIALLLAAQAASAALVQSRQTLPFLFESVRHIEDGPTFAPPIPYYLETQTLHFTGFDPSLGTLQDAYLSYEGKYGIEYATIAGVLPVCAEGVYDVFAIGRYEYWFGLSAPGAGVPIDRTIHNEAYSTIVNGIIAHGNCGRAYFPKLDGSGPKMPGDGSIDGDYEYRPWVTSGSLDTPLLSLADGLDVTAGTIDVTLNKAIEQLLIPIFSSSIWPTYSQLDNYLNEWSGDIALTYVYETAGPTPAHEPASLLLVSMGLLGMGLVGRSNRRTH